MNSIFNKLIIAEIGSVHDGSFGNACKLIEAAATSGATAVKFQTHIAEAETLKDAPMPPYFKGEPRWDYFQRTSFSFDQWKELKSICERFNILFLSSPFSHQAVDLLEKLDLSLYKIPSGEVSNIPLLETIAETKKPVLLSSGMSSWEELDHAVEIFKKTNTPLGLMQCSSQYPCPPENVGLNIMLEMKNRYSVPVGLSDHTMGVAAPIAAVSLGASFIEKHFTFSRSMYGSDAKHSMEPEEFKQLSQSLKETWEMLESPIDKSKIDNYREMKLIFEKSIVLAQDLDPGTVLQKSHLEFKKPGDGIPAADYQKVIGKKLKNSLPKNHKLSPSDLE